MSDDNQNFKFSELASTSVTSNDSINFSFKHGSNDSGLINFKFSELASTSITSDDLINFNFQSDDNASSVVTTDLVADSIYISENTTYCVLQVVKDSIAVSDDISQEINAVHLVTEQCTIADQVVQVVNRTQLIVDQCSITDTINDHLSRSDVITEQFTATDVVLDQSRTIIVDQVHVADYDRSYKQANVTVKEKIHVTDRSIRVHADTVMDALRVSDTVNARVRATEAIREQAVISDQLQSSITFSQHITEKLIIHDVAKGSLTAKQYIQDHIFIDDLILNQPTTGYAWTANADTWAMSRYDGYNYQDLAVIDGVLYGLGEDGVYRLNAEMPVQGKLTTGKIDLGRGQLVHPVAAYLEYELSGSSKQIQVGVGTTQSGVKQTYFYQLPTETADYLTNGRVLFGRGLRGRHFSFEINISGEHGYINDLNIDLAATKRRV
ncbi:hypothetical protein LVY74_01560 [Acinetobacter sp. ME22]|uniref:hypothetical protein n=1 Tax=Acinetobacter sp. ME22 TaxID=2904802 RepID=UPI001EDC51C6|nr:hypothetical protein [Acinetobacter sp. ME22]MCG2572243.1 hypothetical protein [Acinetobacter sp. ME22]